MGCSGQIYSVKGPHGRAHTYTQETARQVSIREACQPHTLSSQYLSLFQKVAFLLDWSDVPLSLSLYLLFLPGKSLFNIDSRKNWRVGIDKTCLRNLWSFWPFGHKLSFRSGVPTQVHKYNFYLGIFSFWGSFPINAVIDIEFKKSSAFSIQFGTLQLASTFEGLGETAFGCCP